MRRFAKLHGKTSATSAYHNLHHAKGNGNYGFYLMFWDKLFGTMFPITEEYLDNIHKEWELSDSSEEG